MKTLATSVTILTLLGAAAPAWPWGCEGHETIALIAQKHLTAHARSTVDRLLEQYAVDPQLRHSCRPSGLGVMAERSTWADDVRKNDRSPYSGTGHWHFIDIPRRAVRGDLSKFCPRRAGCIIGALTDQLAVLRNGTAGQRRMAEALMFVIHLVGDLHQPLHCITNNDLGANCVPVAYFGQAPHREHPDSNVYEPNLHAVWDGLIISRILDHHGSAWFAHVLDNRFAAQIAVWELDPIDLNAWAWETHHVAQETAYGRLPVAVPEEKPKAVTQCDETSEKMLQLHEQLGQPYQNAAVPVVEEQLAKAGIRLAMVLNQLWP